MSKLSKLKAGLKVAGRIADAVTEGTALKPFGDLAGRAAGNPAEAPQTAREMAVEIVAANCGHLLTLDAQYITYRLATAVEQVEAWLIVEAKR
jgi:hypothetical protein